MGSKEPGEAEKAKRSAQRSDERIETYKSLADQAYALFDGKFSMREIGSMPFKELMERIDRERKNNEKLRELREANSNNGGQQ